ncbi:methyltransferase, TIGR04325 family [Paraburkholderia sp. UYCP14C]|uniref:methyltransferase, TIGR04325 family n=1 Tax=Paraburkholderia sp. UYCP14C TaxID=2511130 RepID=UPI0010220312|nr:methyltransferase, TIGR04325 family [Paraburkholderia sp. UYCP14C]RZF24872.1 methyltransferase, TIGR04325 family [Paraburkholderia sp. UYCP14C]
MPKPSHLLSPTYWLCRLTPEFIGRYPSWSAARAAADGYDAPEILQAVRASALKVKRGEAAFERDSVCFEREEFRWPLLGCLLHAAIIKQRNLHVADFGGSLGSFYYQHGQFLQQIEGLQWSIVEQSDYVTVGREDFEDDTLKFYSTLGCAAARNAIDVTLFSGSLQYLDDPFDHIRQAAALSNCIVIDRTPFIDEPEDRITVQRVPASIYKASYPHRFISTEKFARFMAQVGYDLFCEWEGFDQAHVGSRYLGRAYFARVMARRIGCSG